MTPPEKMKDWPVTYVSLNEARAYCQWAGGRLPHAWEWQYAAQGTDGRSYPWGDKECDDCWPTFNTGITFTGPEDVTAHAPAGDSPFGVSDMAGNVWQYTDEVNDEHTRSVIVRGGSNYRPSASHWYFPNRGGDGSGVPCTTHNKYMLFDDEYERAGTIGFRCVTDAA
jgi:formylglycine-generating enzyme required for sulfatase activity